MTKPLVVSVPCKLLSVDVVNGKNREGKDVEYFSCSIFCIDNGFCGSLSVADRGVYSHLESFVGTDVTLICNYNVDYKTLRVVNIE